MAISDLIRPIKHGGSGGDKILLTTKNKINFIFKYKLNHQCVKQEESRATYGKLALTP